MSQRILDLIERRKRWIAINQENGFEEGIKNLLTDLYPDSAHFVFELLQNAEDAKATVAIFRLLNNSLEFEHNSSRLFSIDDVESITSIGRSYKKDDPTNIGKFGVGFKSVYSYTLTPEVISGEYHFQIHDLVVPHIVGLDSIGVNQDLTRITIPFNNPNKTSENAVTEVQTLLNTLNESSLLFLESITKIEYSLPNGQTGYVEREDGDDHLVHIKTVMTNDTEPNVVSYYKFNKAVEVPDEKRCTKLCNISIAYRVEQTSTNEKSNYDIGWKTKQIEPGRVCIYFPAEKEISNLKFHINAPFASTVARDSIRDCEENKSLRDQIAALVVESLFFLRDNNLLTVDFLSVLPNSKDDLPSFYRPILSKVVDAFKNEDLTPMKMGGHAAASGIFRGTAQLSSLLTDEDLIVLLNDDYTTPMWVANAPLRNSRSDDFLSMLEINEYKVSDFVTALSDMPSHIYEWIIAIGFERLIMIYYFLAKLRKEPEALDLKKSKIVPIEEDDRVIFSCVDIQPIYLEATKHDIEVLKEKPSCIKVPVRFLDKQFYDLIKNKDDIIEWLKDVLFVHPFSLEKYALDTNKWFCANHNSLTDEQFIETSNYILDHSSNDTQLIDFPILLSDGRRMLFSNGKSLVQELVTPSGLNQESGWQLIFSSQDDRKHFLILSDLYISDKEKAPKIVTFTKATRNPPLFKAKHYPQRGGLLVWRNNSDYSDSEKKLLDTAYQGSAVSREHDIYISRVTKPSGLCNDLSERTSTALIRWLNGRYKNSYQSSIAKDLMTEIGWYNHGLTTEKIESEMSSFLLNEAWLPSTKGFQKPSHVFKKTSGVYDVLGDTVPYFEHDLNEVVSEFLGIRVELSNDELISYLLDLSSSSEGNIQTAERVYSTLNSREIAGKVKDQLISSDCIAILKDCKVKWVSPKVCVWKDRSDLFDNEFYFLSNLYPKLRNFFVDVLNVASDIGDEQFCELWLDMQIRDLLDVKVTEDKLTMLYHRLKPLFDSSDEISEEWWGRFISQAMLWSSSKRFVKTYQVYIPDNGILKDAFVKEQVDYLWYPKGSSYSQWESLHRAFKLRSLKDSVSITLKDVEDSVIVNPATHLTRSAKTLILVWLREKHPERFQSLVDKGIVNEFVRTAEYRSDKLIISYELEGRVVEASSDAYLDLLNGRAYYVATACKPAIAAEICRALSVNEHNEDLESWIKGVLGSDEADLQAELKQKKLADY